MILELYQLREGWIWKLASEDDNNVEKKEIRLLSDVIFYLSLNLENNINDNEFLTTELKQVTITHSEKIIELQYLHTLLP